MRLWYEQPAGLWEEALPLGNGRLGAMVFGGADDLLCLNEDTFWSGYPQNKDRVGAVRYLSEARRLLDAGDTASAEALVERELLTGYHESYLPLGELRVSLPGAPSDDYRRALSLEEGVVSSCYTAVSYTHLFHRHFQFLVDRSPIFFGYDFEFCHDSLVDTKRIWVGFVRHYAPSFLLALL